MAKDQRRGNREARKPKANKTPISAAPSVPPTKGAPTPAFAPKKKN
jgi:hypothetical protein